MATQPNTQPVTTPALTNSLIREVLNPTPRYDATSAEWQEHGYRAAMLDAALAEYDDSEEMTRTEFRHLINEVFSYYGCEWHIVEWDYDAEQQLESIVNRSNRGVGINRNGKSIKARKA